MNLNIIRPSSVVRSIEDGFIGAAQLLRNVAVAAGQDLAEFRHRASVEMRARRMADAQTLADTLRETQDADLAEITARLDQLLAERRAKRKFVVMVPADQEVRIIRANR
jgi:hypothetical protein